MVIRTVGQNLVIQASGELDVVTSPALLDTLTTAMSAAITTVTFDLRDVTFMDSSAIKVIIYARNRLRNHGGKVIVCNARPAAAKLIRLLGLDHEVSLFEQGDERSIAPEQPGVSHG